MKPEYSFALAMLVPYGVLSLLLRAFHARVRAGERALTGALLCIFLAPTCILAARPAVNALVPTLATIGLPTWVWAGIAVCCAAAGFIVWRASRSNALIIAVLAGCVVAPMFGALLRHGFSGAWYMRSEGLALVVSIAGWAAAYLPCVALPLFFWLRRHTPRGGSSSAVPSRA